MGWCRCSFETPCIATVWGHAGSGGPRWDGPPRRQSSNVAACRRHHGSVGDSDLSGRSVLIVDDHGSHRTSLLEYVGGLGSACERALENRQLHPSSASGEGDLLQAWGGAWEWTGSAYAPYPA
jgi:hypothetical protein